MRYLNRYTSILISVTKLLEIVHQPRALLHSHLRPANSLLKEHIKSNATHKALLLFQALWRRGSSSIDSFSLLFALKACVRKSSAVEGRQIHALTVKIGLEHLIFLQTMLINMYSALGYLGDARRMFDEVSSKNVVCWTALISAYVDNGKPSEALKLFRQMQMEKIEPDQVTVTVVLSACADIGALEMGEWIHSYIRRKQGFESDLHLKNALLNMYVKCGEIGKAKRLFDRIKNKDVTTWTSMIVGHALHGQAEEALRLYEKMKDENKSKRQNEKGLILPNDVTFIGVLMACSHAGLVEEGRWHFNEMSKNYSLKPRIPHFGCMVDLLCQAGLLEEAYAFIVDMPIRPNAVVWRTLLGACCIHGNFELGANARRHLLQLEPGHVSDDVARSNAYAAAGMWDKKLMVRTHIKQRRDPGCSSIEIKGEVHEFVAADKSHPCRSEIYEALETLIKLMKDSGYAPEISSPKEY